MTGERDRGTFAERTRSKYLSKSGKVNRLEELLPLLGSRLMTEAAVQVLRS